MSIFFSLKLTSQKHFQKLFQKVDFHLTNIQLLPRLVQEYFNTKYFIIFYIKQLPKFHKVSSILCSVCNKEEESISHLFQTCTDVKSLWMRFYTFAGSALVILRIFIYLVKLVILVILVIIWSYYSYLWIFRY